jgi:diguanylate cyclase (GGDEF)-like protein
MPTNNYQLNELETNLLVLNYANLLVSALTDRERTVDVALDCLADFSGSRRLALWMMADDGQSLRLAGLRAGDETGREALTLPLAASGFASLQGPRHDALLPGRLLGQAPLPAAPGEPATLQVLVMPVLALSGEFFGYLVLEACAEPDLATRQYLRVLVTTLAISLANARLFELAVIDGLTRAYVRRYFEIRLDEELARLTRQPGSLAVIMLDLDDFKQVNDRFGHAVGDHVLQELTAILRGNVRQGVDVVSRYGGEEFTILMPGATAAEGLATAERLRGLCAARSFGEDIRLEVTFSAGVAGSGEVVPLTAAGLMALVDQRLYAAKGRGRDCVVGAC